MQVPTTPWFITAVLMVSISLRSTSATYQAMWRG